MDTLASASKIFPLICADHPFAPQVAEFAAMVAEHMHAYPLPDLVHTEIKAIPAGTAGWQIDRFYWSGQYRDWPAGNHFHAETLSFRAGQGAAWRQFPCDAYLGDLGVPMAGLQAGWPMGQLTVLRYVPLRRLTFRLSGEGMAPLVGKFKRRSRFREAHVRLEAVAQAIAAGQASFRVARPAGMDSAAGVTFQEALPGIPLPDVLNQENSMQLFGQLGALHRSLHELPVCGVPAWDVAGFWAGVKRDLDWISFMQPQLAEVCVQIGQLLAATRPSQAEPPMFCHGDFVPSQILVDPQQWGVIDFDLCRMGEPAQELAMLLAGLPYDVPALGSPMLLQAASAAYLAGYAERAGHAVDLARLSWYRVCAELYYMALALKKDWLDQPGFVAAQQRLMQALLAHEEQQHATSQY